MKPGSSLMTLLDPNKSSFVNFSLASLSLSVTSAGILSTDVHPPRLSISVFPCGRQGNPWKQDSRAADPDTTGWNHTLLGCCFSVAGRGPSCLWPLLIKHSLHTAVIKPHSSQPKRCRKWPTHNSSKNNQDQNYNPPHARMHVSWHIELLLFKYHACCTELLNTL